MADDNESVPSYDGFSDYPLPLRQVQRNKLDDFVKLVDSCSKRNTVLNCVHSKSGDTALIVAARHGHLDVMKFLIQSGVDIEQRNKDLKRALHEAASGSHLECVKLLISHKAEIDCLKRADWSVTVLICSHHATLLSIRHANGRNNQGEFK